MRLLRVLLVLPLLLAQAPARADGAAPTPASRHAADRPPARRRVTPAEQAKLRQVLRLEETWLRAKDARVVAPMLAADFLHPVASGQLLDRAQHLAWLARHPPAPGLRRRFGALKIRLLGEEVAVVNGRVDVRDAKGQVVRRTMFTDVWRYLQGRWQAVSAQETPVAPPAPKAAHRP